MSCPKDIIPPSECPPSIILEDGEWEALDDEQRVFFMEAQAGGMAYLLMDGEPIAWGATSWMIFNQSETVDREGYHGEVVVRLDPERTVKNKMFHVEQSEAVL